MLDKPTRKDEFMTTIAAQANA
ncbi:MAG: hypothetical protein QOJ95_4934, partial [Mycobacterium sp.]|nr:hypothetical protein [Mycobacterium sp.]